MGNIIPFSFEGHGVRSIIDENGQPWFNASDVCDALEMGNSSQVIKSHVDLDDLQKLEVIDNLGRTQRANHVNESGLYSLILGSRKPAAKRFKRWVTSEVLPSIRKTGSPGADNVQYLNDPIWLRGALITYTERVERLERQANDNAPKLQAYDLIATSSDGSLSVTEVAKLLQQRPRDLFTWLAVNKWLYRRAGGRSWLAYQSRIQSGFMEHKITEVTQPDGLPRFIEQARITRRGLLRLAHAFGVDLPEAATA
ncbi:MULTISPECIES: BRO family protein [Haematospirillum]|uniref:BRO family protein n=1 Tax=Haematospirillum TaxID=1804663 RepID=UPI0014333C66|nr:MULTISPECIES: phage antirepressor [Haematospirillum]NKD55157.1 phage repressor protein/antirepressor Ant [Haematospirillum sp. H4890]NKD75410.1 phage repressor protein/antirepressor Ant [Haematospirillum sp. H4485]NKD92720.1 phage repressor protein/antirepressor Ant [Haematospirillum jordaniae]